jgi:iron(III) transport system substrate-binding protein
MMKLFRPDRWQLWSLMLVIALLVSACQGIALTPTTTESADSASEAVASEAGDKLVIYSGRSENLVAPLMERFKQDTGIDVEVRYGGTAELAATILEEGANSPADVFFAQDAGSLGALAQAGRLTVLPDEVLNRVDTRFRSPTGEWVGASGRARTLVYNTERVQESDLPRSAFDLTGEQWNGLVGWAPTNASFQSFVTAMRQLSGEDATRQWLEEMLANGVQSFDNNAAIVEAVGRGEILGGLVNHYYLFRFLEEQGEGFPARNYFFPDGGADALINIAGIGILDSSDNQANALTFANYLLEDAAQQYFVEETGEYPLVTGIAVGDWLTPIDQLNPPAIDLSDLSDLQGTLDLLQEVGALQ